MSTEQPMSLTGLDPEKVWGCYDEGQLYRRVGCTGCAKSQPQVRHKPCKDGLHPGWDWCSGFEER